MFRNPSGSIDVVNLIKENGGSWHLDSAVFIPNIMREEAKYFVKPEAGDVDRVPVLALQRRDPHPRVYPACHRSENSAVASMWSSPSPPAFLRSGKYSVGGVSPVIKCISRTQVRISVASLFPQQSLGWDNFVLCSCPVIFMKLQSCLFEITCALQILLFVSNYHLFFFLPDFCISLHLSADSTWDEKVTFWIFLHFNSFSNTCTILLCLSSEPICVHHSSLDINLEESLICPNAAVFTQTHTHLLCEVFFPLVIHAIGHESSSGRLNICKGAIPWRFIQVLERSVVSPSVRNLRSCLDFECNCAVIIIFFWNLKACFSKCLWTNSWEQWFAKL